MPAGETLEQTGQRESRDVVWTDGAASMTKQMAGRRVNNGPKRVEKQKNETFHRSCFSPAVVFRRPQKAQPMPGKLLQLQPV